MTVNAASYSRVIAGLDPAIHPLRKMDHRVTRLRRGPVMTPVVSKGDLK
jgi:hypothetical protein